MASTRVSVLAPPPLADACSCSESENNKEKEGVIPCAVDRRDLLLSLLIKNSITGAS